VLDKTLNGVRSPRPHRRPPFLCEICHCGVAGLSWPLLSHEARGTGSYLRRSHAAVELTPGPVARDTLQKVSCFLFPYSFFGGEHDLVARCSQLAKILFLDVLG